jgi:hypothetical protein
VGEHGANGATARHSKAEPESEVVQDREPEDKAEADSDRDG